jgi:hypothetical protein
MKISSKVVKNDTKIIILLLLKFKSQNYSETLHEFNAFSILNLSFVNIKLLITLMPQPFACLSFFAEESSSCEDEERKRTSENVSLEKKFLLANRENKHLIPNHWIL